MQHLYVDGGVIGRNPSPDGGTWAYCLVDNDNETVLLEGSGLLLPYEHGVGNLVTNNQTEYLAMLRGLQALPSGWRGVVRTDSQITLGRFAWVGWKTANIPDHWVQAGAVARQRLGAPVTYELLSGHPSDDELVRGIGRGLRPVSAWNVYVDTACQEMARTFLEERSGEAAAMRAWQAVGML
jgi:ribonuclease HI